MCTSVKLVAVITSPTPTPLPPRLVKTSGVSVNRDMVSMTKSKREENEAVTRVPNVVKMDDYDDFGEYMTAIAQAVLIHGYARAWSPRHPNDTYLAVHPPLTDVARANLETEFERVMDEELMQSEADDEEEVPF